MTGLVGNDSGHHLPWPLVFSATVARSFLPGQTGFVVPPNDIVALGIRIRQLVNDPVLGQSMGKAARRHVEQNFTWDKVAERGLACYHDLLP